MLTFLVKSNFFAFVVSFNELLDALIAAVLFVVFGLIISGVAYLFLHFVMPFSIREELEVKENPALAVIIGSLLISIVIIVSAAIRS